MYLSKPQIIYASSSLMLVILMVSLSVQERDSNAVPIQQWRATEVVRATAGRHPTLVEVQRRLILFWADGYPILTSEDYGPLPATLRMGMHKWPLCWAHIANYDGKPVEPQRSALFCTWDAGPVYHRPAICGNSQGLLVVYARHIYDSMSADEAVVQKISISSDQAPGEASALTNPPATVLPHSLPETRVVGKKAPLESLPGKWFIYPARPVRDFKRLDLCCDPHSHTYYLCGEDHISGTIWMTASPDGTTWRELTTLASDVCFPAICAHADQIIVTFTDAGQFSYQNLWWDDDPPEYRANFFWPARGSLKYRLSSDGGEN